jgi:hypothetical protein
MSSPLSHRRGARIQRRESRKEGIVVEKGSSSQEEMDFEQIEFVILHGDAAEAVVDDMLFSMKKEEAVISRVSSTESVKKEMKKRKKKSQVPVGPPSQTTSTESTGKVKIAELDVCR